MTYENHVSNTRKRESRIQIFPNPVTEKTEIKFNLSADSYAKLGIYDMFGNQIASLADGFFGAGVLSANWNASGIASGTWFALKQKEKQLRNCW